MSSGKECYYFNMSDAEIIKAREDGHTFAQIGEMLGISMSAARIRYILAKRRAEEKASGSFHSFLSVRARNVFISSDINSVEDLMRRVHNAKSAREFIRDTPNLGKKTLVEAFEALGLPNPFDLSDEVVLSQPRPLPPVRELLDHYDAGQITAEDFVERIRALSAV